MPGCRMLLWLLPVTFACAQPAERQAAAPAVDSAAVIAAAGDFWARYVAADTANDVNALVALFTDSVRVDARGAPVLLGRAAVQSFIENMMKTTRTTSLAVTPDMTVPVSNETVYQNGSYTEAMATGNQGVTEYGRYAVALRKGADGQWRINYLMAFTDSTVPVRK